MNFIVQGWFCELQLHLFKRYQWQLDIPCSSCEEKQKKEKTFKRTTLKLLIKKKKKKDKTTFPLQISAAARLGSIWNNQFSWNMHMIWLRPVQTWGKNQDCLILFQVRMQALHIGHSRGASAAWADEKCPCGAGGSSWHTEHRADHAVWPPVLLYIPAVTLP